MIMLRFEGYSDDTFGEYQTFQDDYDNCASGKPIEWLVESAEGKLIVVGQHCPGHCGGWLIGVSRTRDVPDWQLLPDWPMRFESGEKPYSAELVIEAPDDVTIRCLQRTEEVTR